MVPPGSAFKFQLEPPTICVISLQLVIFRSIFYQIQVTFLSNYCGELKIKLKCMHHLHPKFFNKVFPLEFYFIFILNVSYGT